MVLDHCNSICDITIDKCVLLRKGYEYNFNMRRLKVDVMRKVPTSLVDSGDQHNWIKCSFHILFRLGVGNGHFERKTKIKNYLETRNNKMNVETYKKEATKSVSAGFVSSAACD